MVKILAALFFGGIAAFNFWVAISRIRSGKIVQHQRTILQKDHPIMFWFDVGLQLLVGLLLLCLACWVVARKVS